MSLREKLADFAGSLSSAMLYAPDAYPDWSYVTYDNNMADLREFWAEIREKLKHDQEKVPFIDEKLQEAFAAFDEGEQEKGRLAVWAIYNLGVTKLR